MEQTSRIREIPRIAPTVGLFVQQTYNVACAASKPAVD